MADHNELGKKGELVALKFLKSKQYVIRERNWRFRKNEVDLIAEKDNLLVVVEVKTRTSEYFENPKEAVTRKKQKYIIQATEAYIQEKDLDLEVRFDIVAVTIINGQISIEHIEDAFQPSLLL
ncbi:MAG: YraN family protein [Bacteroidales bacterium]|jgi:putative endonuclease|nr:YraN family protein [Bacteroidales bacterium]